MCNWLQSMLMIAVLAGPAFSLANGEPSKQCRERDCQLMEMGHRSTMDDKIGYTDEQVLMMEITDEKNGEPENANTAARNTTEKLTGQYLEMLTALQEMWVKVSD